MLEGMHLSQLLGRKAGSSGVVSLQSELEALLKSVDPGALRDGMTRGIVSGLRTYGTDYATNTATDLS